MLEQNVNLWTVDADARCVTTNGAVRNDGACVMGAGCAKEAAQFDPRIPFQLGELIAARGNVTQVIRHRPGKPALVAFPVKHHWREAADLALIERSAEQLVALADARGFQRIALPRPGCGNGRLKWAQVRPVLAGLLDDRFVVVHVPARGR